MTPEQMMRTRALPEVTVGRVRCSTVRGEEVEVTTSAECVCGRWVAVAMVGVDMMCGYWDEDIE